MTTLKYLVLREATGVEFPVFCTGLQTHAELATAWLVGPARRRVVSAGFVRFAAEGVTVCGHSESLDLAPRPQDARLIAVCAHATHRMADLAAPPAHTALYP